VQSNESACEQSDEVTFVSKGVLENFVYLSTETGQVGQLHVSIAMLGEFGETINSESARILYEIGKRKTSFKKSSDLL